MKTTTLLLICLAFLGCAKTSQKPEETTQENRPNIVLIMGDDIGFSDISCYGGEIPTPNLDQLASQGIRFSQFYNMAKCETTRTVMHTGLYQGNDQAINFAQLLRDAGYYTAQSGKEHFKNWVPEHCYAKNVMDQSFTFWATNEFFIPPGGEFERPFILNGDTLKASEIPFKGKEFYKTDVITDYAIKYLEEAKQKEKPFLLYLPYHAAHYPLQAPEEEIAKFRGKYKKGWDKIRKERFERIKTLGLIPEQARLSPPEGNINKFRGHKKDNLEIRGKIPLYRPWETLSEEEQDELDLEMSVFAAMVHRMDKNIGRVIQWLEENDKRENTLILYLSDNGSCPYDSNKDFDHPPGTPDSYRTLSAAWANAGNTPFRYFKQYGHEGGSHTHLIANWPSVIKEKGVISDQPGHLVDFYPTFLEAAGVQYPENYKGKSTLPLHGTSLMPIFKGETRTPPKQIISGFTERFRMYRKGDWKIVNLNGEGWELYHLAKDPTELNNLAPTNPEKLKELLESYEAWKLEVES
ncbi:arylsulfatase [Flexithrix dorotheae]|uniref:arylsulfatase n=1 Tax=Flexithrix dorotheae TaxID=70993 RepID=UPI0003A61FCD|nr:arylsulfatase [Flexithrix dorotheae]